MAVILARMHYWWIRHQEWKQMYAETHNPRFLSWSREALANYGQACLDAGF